MFRLPSEVFIRRMKISLLHPVLGTVSSRWAKFFYVLSLTSDHTTETAVILICCHRYQQSTSSFWHPGILDWLRHCSTGWIRLSAPDWLLWSKRYWKQYSPTAICKYLQHNAVVAMKRRQPGNTTQPAVGCYPDVCWIWQDLIREYIGDEAAENSSLLSLPM